MLGFQFKTCSACFAFRICDRRKMEERNLFTSKPLHTESDIERLHEKTAISCKLFQSKQEFENDNQY